MAKKTLPGVLILSQDHAWQAVVHQALKGVAKIRRVRGEAELLDALSSQLTPATLLLVDMANFSDTITLLEFIKKWKPRIAIAVAASVPSWRDARELILSGASDYMRKSEIVDDIRFKLMAVMNKLKA